MTQYTDIQLILELINRLHENISINIGDTGISIHFNSEHEITSIKYNTNR